MSVVLIFTLFLGSCGPFLFCFRRQTAFGARARVLQPPPREECDHTRSAPAVQQTPTLTRSPMH
ncbi:hypothetical protein M407DRAFT_242140 [Tulasnella calospora MUT 4182]|uniref:Uncharacterized protein n=1 Tax=Tulasnella calospora MUT 4182 TaxID=1051891 RepID=A0A0C3QRX3_9AGAM|nr:hypothetical protein M407DRAFT_242140 [Tulasnella calospora MUT 4182]